MMGLVVVFTLYFLLCGIHECHMTFLNEDDQLLMDAHEKAKYHLGELQESVARISSLQKRSLRTKRDQEAAQIKRKADFLFFSLTNFCIQIQDFNENNPNVTIPTASPTPRSTTSSDFDELESGYWMKPAVRPTQVQAVRLDENTVEITFDVIESTPFVITRVAGFDIEKLEISKGHSSKDHLGFKIDTSTFCDNEYYNEIDNQFVFEAKNNPVTAATLIVNVCNFDKFQDESLPWENRTWETRHGPHSEAIVMSKVRIDSNITNDIVLIPGRNISFEMTVFIDDRSYILLHAIFYDRKAKQIIINSLSYGFSQEIKRNPSIGSEREFLVMDFLKSSVTEGGSGDRVIKEIKSRVTLITDSGQLTGKLYISSADKFGDYYNPTVVRASYAGQEIKIRKPNKRHVLPRRKARLLARKTLLCDQEGNRRLERNGKNCTVICEAMGRGLISLTISKKDGHVPVYRSVTQKWSDRLITLIDVGPASPDIEGTYVCTVTSAKGKYQDSTETQLFASGFPKIDQNETTIVDIGNDTTRITCVVFGRLPINVSISVSGEGEPISLSNRNDSLHRDMEDGQGTIVTVEVPTDELRFPAQTLQFRAISELGNVYYSTYIGDIIPNHMGDVKIVAEESKIVNFSNGTTAITCTASGRPPLTIWMFLGINRIDNVPEYIRVETENRNKKSVTLFANTFSLIRTSARLYCKVRNNHSRDEAVIDEP